MCRKSRVRNPLFARRWISDDVIILCVRWYLRFRLSYRDLASIAAELGIAVAPSTILRWVIRYSGEFVRRWDAGEIEDLRPELACREPALQQEYGCTAAHRLSDRLIEEERRIRAEYAL